MKINVTTNFFFSWVNVLIFSNVKFAHEIDFMSRIIYFFVLDRTDIDFAAITNFPPSSNTNNSTKSQVFYANNLTW